MPSSTGTLSFLFFSNSVLGASLCQALGSMVPTEEIGRRCNYGKFSLRAARPALQVAVRVPSTPARGPSALYRPPCPLRRELGELGELGVAPI